MSTSRGTRNGRSVVASMICAGSLCTAHAASALELNYDLSAGIGHSDNIARTEDNEIDEAIASAGLEFSLAQQSRRVMADLIGNFAYYDYLDETYEAEFLGNFAGTANFQIVPERFTWVIADNFGQVLNDPFQPATPDNREYINYFMTGPDVFVGLGSQTRLRIGGRYTNTNYEDRPFDSDAVLGEAELSRLLSGRSSVSLNVRAQQTEFDEAALNADYDQSEAFLRYDITGARTVLGVEAGYTEVDTEAAEGSDSGLLLRFDASRRLSSSSTASLTAGREFSSAGARFASTQAGAGVGLGATPGRQTTDPFIRTYASLGWDFARNRTGFGIRADWNDESYEDQPLQDQTLTGVSAYFDRELSSVSTFAISASYSSAEFDDVDGGYDEIGARVSYSRRLSQRITLDLSYDWFDRSSDAVGGDYTENRFWLSISYGRGAPRNRALPPQYGMDATTSPASP